MGVDGDVVCHLTRRPLGRRILELHDILGTIGVALIIVMYLLLQSGRMTTDNLQFSIWNAVGSVLILISLAYEFNLSAALVEGFWLLISIYGFIRAKRAA